MLCNDYICLFTFDRFCQDCSNIRRLIKLEGNAKDFLNKIKKLFLINSDQPITEEKPKEKNEEKKKNKQEDILKYAEVVKELNKKQKN